LARSAPITDRLDARLPQHTVRGIQSPGFRMPVPRVRRISWKVISFRRYRALTSSEFVPREFMLDKLLDRFDMCAILTASLAALPLQRFLSTVDCLVNLRCS
jgi:hypothetical protein